MVTATGLNLLLLGGMHLSVHGEEVVPSETVGYKGMMLSGVPNLAFTVGYTNASWTLKGDLVQGYVCRMLNHMDEHGYRICMPRGPDPAQPTMPFLDLDAGYVRRALDTLPRQGANTPWRLHQNYLRDVVMLRYGPLQDDAITFSADGAPRPDPELVAA